MAGGEFKEGDLVEERATGERGKVARLDGELVTVRFEKGVMLLRLEELARDWVLVRRAENGKAWDE